jgi:hypothetical protein
MHGDLMTKAKYEISSLGTIGTFLKVGTCSEALCNVVDRAFNQPMKLEEHASMPLAGGIMQHGYQCGMIWGAALAGGAQAYRLLGSGPQAEIGAIIAAQRLVDSFQAHNHHIDCLDVIDTDWQKSGQVLKYFLKGGPVGCFRMAGRYGPVAFSEIRTALSEKLIETPLPPVSCSALVARKMGASDMHRIMAAGFAGGVGLSGSACGALGAVIWINELNGSKEGAGKVEFKSPKAKAAIERFLKFSDSKFKCSEIVGRKFENVSDHAGYLREGGCSKIIEVLAED